MTNITQDNAPTITQDDVPKHAALRLIILRTISSLGGSALHSQLPRAVAEHLNFPEEIHDIPTQQHPGTSLLATRISFARSTCKGIGAIESPKPGLSVLTNVGRDILALPIDRQTARINELTKAFKRSYYEKKKAKAAAEAKEEKEEKAAEAARAAAMAPKAPEVAPVVAAVAEKSAPAASEALPTKTPDVTSKKRPASPSATTLGIPPKSELRFPLLQAINDFGGEAEFKQIPPRVRQLLGLSEDALTVGYDSRPNASALTSRLSFARSDCKSIGALESRDHGISALTNLGREIVALGAREGAEKIRSLYNVIQRDIRRAQRASAREAEESARAQQTEQTAAAQVAPAAEAPRPQAAPAVAAASAEVSEGVPVAASPSVETRDETSPSAAVARSAATQESEIAGDLKSQVLERLQKLSAGGVGNFLADLASQSDASLLELIDIDKTCDLMLEQLQHGKSIGLRRVVSVDVSYFDRF